MDHATAQRKLVKSPPELWAEVSSEDALGRRLAPFGEIRITRVDPETTVAWEGERASGTVELEPAGWGTKVTLSVTAAAAAEAEAAVPEVVAEAQPAWRTDPPPPPLSPKPGFFARLFRRPGAPATPQDFSPPAPGPEPTPPEPDPAPTLRQPAPDDRATQTILTEMLDDLGAAHHRPFSRD